MSQETAALLLILAVGAFGRNYVVAVGAIAALILAAWPLPQLLEFLANNGIKVGIFMLMIAVLAELAVGRVPLHNLARELWSIPSLLAILGGILASWMSGRGIELLQRQPQVAIGLVIGSVLGASFFNGVPIGPLFAAGVTAVAMGLWQVLSR
jgi:uncharacterized membrane protein (DUF441 family)